LLDSGKVKINWLNSSKDVKFNYIYRRENTTQQWQLVKRTNAEDEKYADEPSHHGIYRYKVVAEDSATNKSNSREVEIHFVKNRNYPPVKLTNVNVDREKKIVRISWTYKQDGVTKFLIYRGVLDSGLSLHKSIMSPAEDFVDENATINTTYIYRVKAIFKDGSESGFSNEMKVNF